MFTKLKQRVVRGGAIQKCFKGLREAHVDAALPYRTVARWVDAFREDGDAVQDNLRTGRPHVKNNTNSLLPCCMLIADGLRVSQQRKSEYVTKLCSTFCTTFWVTANLQRIGYSVKFPRCNKGTAMQSLDRYQREDGDFLGRIVAMDETWARSYEPNSKCQSN